MTLSFNFTGRQQIDAEHFKANISESVGKFVAEIAWELDSYAFDSDAELFVTFNGVYEQQTESLGILTVPAGEEKIDVTHLRNPLDLSITLKVIKKNLSGVPIIIGLLTHFHPLQNGSKTNDHGILPTKRDPDLLVPWRIVTDEGRPILHISDRKGIYDNLVTSPIFEHLVISSIVEAAYEWLVIDAGVDRDEEAVDQWRAFFARLGYAGDHFDEVTPAEDMDIEEMRTVRDRALAAADEFATKSELVVLLAKSIEGEND